MSGDLDPIKESYDRCTVLDPLEPDSDMWVDLDANGVRGERPAVDRLVSQIEIVGDRAVFTPSQSKTDLTTFQIGVVLVGISITLPLMYSAGELAQGIGLGKAMVATIIGALILSLMSIPAAGWDGRIARYEDGAWRSFLPGQGDGLGWLAYVQDEASQLVPCLMGSPAAGPVLDLCAAPGGKTLQLAEAVGPDAHVVAFDRSEAGPLGPPPRDVVCQMTRWDSSNHSGANTPV